MTAEDGTAQLKKCSKCGQIKPLNDFYSSGKRGLHAWCKKCDNADGRNYKKKKQLEACPEGYQICKKCGKAKHIDDFLKTSRQRDGIRYKCKECAEACDREHDEIQKEKELIRGAAHYQKIEAHRRWAKGTIDGHRHQGMIVNISLNELTDLARNTTNCPICGCKLSWQPKGKISSNSPTLDRRYNGRRLTLQNTWIICWRCNVMKQDVPMPEYVEFCKMVAEKFG